ncbi:PIN domain-containing protein [candidate division WWE3 bacterium]|nr:PIN domain-containing protein [candidate division WWE3 bacterium]
MITKGKIHAMKTYLIDTNVFIRHFRGDKKATRFLKSVRNNSYISYIVAGELLQGVENKKDLAVVEDILDAWEIDWGDSKIHKKGLEILKNVNLKNKLGLLDAIIAATAIKNGSVLVSLNRKHFKDVEGLELRDKF